VTDRWKILRGNVGSGGVMAQGTNLTISDLPFSDVGIKTFGRIGRLSGNTSVNSINIHYSIESQDCYRFVGKPIVFSFYYRTGANFSGTAISSSVYTGTAIDQSLTTGVTGIVTTAGANCNPNTSWQKISYTGLIGTNINQIHVEFYYIPTGTAGAADYFDITGVQMELGRVATPFEVRPYPVEMQMCQRYFSAWRPYLFMMGRFNADGGETYANYSFPVIMRSSSPILILSTATIASATGYSGAITLVYSDNQIMTIRSTVAVSVNNILYLTATAGYIGISAEL
jgi:hypothetical protein